MPGYTISDTSYENCEFTVGRRALRSGKTNRLSVVVRDSEAHPIAKLTARISVAKKSGARPRLLSRSVTEFEPRV